MTDRAYLTTPIYYVNDKPHIGHAYTTTLCDVAARFMRFLGRDVFYLTGTDEHAAKVVDSAAQRGLTPQQWADQNAAAFQDAFRLLHISNDDFIRTTQERHKTRVARYVRALMDSGDVYLGDFEGWYDAGQEEYVTDSKAKEYGYQSPINGKPLVRRKEHNYFFRLSAYREPLLALLERREPVNGATFDVKPEARRNEIIARIREMEDVPISRTSEGSGAPWGIRIPGDEQHT
ncbi:MAG: class I tRNA ligase family protein, partial [Phycisphaerales bacterium]|nr:class I tRNA ligase family protein [Phycisphaerales bacterium]